MRPCTRTRIPPQCPSRRSRSTRTACRGSAYPSRSLAWAMVCVAVWGPFKAHPHVRSDVDRPPLHRRDPDAAVPLPRGQPTLHPHPVPADRCAVEPWYSRVHELRTCHEGLRASFSLLQRTTRTRAGAAPRTTAPPTSRRTARVHARPAPMLNTETQRELLTRSRTAAPHQLAHFAPPPAHAHPPPRRLRRRHSLHAASRLLSSSQHCDQATRARWSP